MICDDKITFVGQLKDDDARNAAGVIPKIDLIISEKNWNSLKKV